jgi:hypothetical protein
MKSFINLLNFLLLLFIGTASVSYATGINPAAVAGAISVMAFIPLPGGALLSTPATNVAAIAKFGGQYAKKLITEVINSLDVVKDLKTDRVIDLNGKLLPSIQINPGAQPLNPYVEDNPGSGRTLSGRMLMVKDCMKIIHMIPDEFRSSFMSAMLEPGAKQVPMAEWIWKAEMEKLGQEINDNFYNQIYKADAPYFNPSSTYTANTSYVKFGALERIYKCISNTSPGESPLTHPAKWEDVTHLSQYDGPAKIIADEITAGNISPVLTGAITSANAYTKVHDVYNAMTTAHKNAGGVIRVSYDVFQKFLEHEKTLYPNALDQNMGDGKKYIYGSARKWEIKPATWMGNSQRIIVDMKGENLCVGTNLAGIPGLSKTIETLHGFKSVAKWTFGFQIADLSVFYCNNQA